MATTTVTKSKRETVTAARGPAPAPGPVPLLVAMDFGGDQPLCAVAYPPGTSPDPAAITREQHLSALAGVVRGLTREGGGMFEPSVYLLVPAGPVGGGPAWRKAWTMGLDDALEMALALPPAAG